MELRITNTKAQDYFFIIKVSKNEVGNTFYLNTKFLCKNNIGGYNGQVHLTFLSRGSGENDSYTEEDSKQFFTRLSATIYGPATYEVFNGWYRLEKVKNKYRYTVPILLKL